MENHSRLPQTKYQNAAFDFSKPADSPTLYTGDFSFGESTDHRFSYFRQASLRQNAVVEPHSPQHGLVSDAFHLTSGCGLLSFSLFAMASRQNPDRAYSYGYKRLEVLSAFTNALFLLFMSFSLAVEALHAFIQDESEHKHYLVISAIANLLVNLIGVWFFRN